ncbi:MAG: ABC-2 type transport system ATP-binding protein [Flavobacteriales bacterium]
MTLGVLSSSPKNDHMLLTANHIIKQYASHRALNDVSISIDEGNIFGLLGPNGAGKTSLIRIINQITAPDSGEVIFDGVKLNPSHISQIGYLPEERGLYKKMKVGEQALYLAQLKGMSKSEASRKLKIWFEKFEIDAWWHKKVEELSKGMAQKIQFITTVLHEPKLLILDEPFSGFDPINANLIKDEILGLAKNGTTVVLSTHNMESVEAICTHIALINQSTKVLDGSVKDIQKQFSKNTYSVHYQGAPIELANAMWANNTLLKNETIDKDQALQHAVIKLDEGISLNDFLTQILSTIKLVGVQELVPSMNDIFIEVVNKNKHNHG